MAKLPKRAISGAAKKRARRMGRKRMGKQFKRNLLESFGLGNYAAKQEQRELRDWKRSLYGSALKKQLQENIVDEPPLETPVKEGERSNPDISALNDQLKKLLKTAKAMGLVDKETQNLALKQIKDANRAARENQLEAPVQAVPEPQEGTGNEISPLADKMSDLIKAFEDLIGTVEDKNDEEQKGFLDYLSDRFGLSEQRQRYKEKPARLKEGFKAETTKTGKVRYRGPDGRITTPEKALQGGYAKKQVVKEAQAARAARTGTTAAAGGGGILSRVAGAAKSIFSPSTAKAGGMAASVARPGVLSRGTSKIASGIKTGAKTAGGLATKGVALTGQALERTIVKVAGPKVAKALATTGVKSIPILGGLVGLGFAASRLVDGDFVGAGLDAVSGLAGPVTAIPAMVASLSRDVYTEVFGVHPETDPQFGERMGVVQGAVKSIVEKQIGKKVQPKEAAAGGQPPQQKAKPPEAVKQTSSAPASISAPNPPPQPAPTDAAKPIDTSQEQKSSPAAPAASAPAATPAVSTGGKAAPAAPEQPVETPQRPVAQSAPEQVKSSQGAVAALSVPPATTTGAQIEAATEAAEAVGTPKPKIGVSTSVIRPARTPTTKTGAKGMGNVPEPTYGNEGIIAKQLYFSASV